MKMRKTSAALISAVLGFATLVATWFVLNHFRVQFYNSAMEGPSPEKSPYWTIIRIQDRLEWPIFILGAAVGALVVSELLRKVVMTYRR